MLRQLQIEKFRNVGVESSEKLILNNSLKKGEMGNLLIVVGANNSGKSNVLDAILKLQTKKIEERDKTTFKYEDEYRKPAISLISKGEEDIFSYNIVYGENIRVDYPKNQVEQVLETKENNIKLCDAIIEGLNKGVLNRFGIERRNENDIGKQSILTVKNGYMDADSQEKAVDLERKLVELVKKYYLERNQLPYVWNAIEQNCLNNQLVKAVMSGFDNLLIEKVNNLYKGKYGVDFLPNVYKYEEKNISSRDIVVDSVKVRENSFFRTLFALIGMDIKELDNAYGTYKNTREKGVLKKFAEKVNKKLKTVARKFNDLYFMENDSYKFEIDCESGQVSFILSRGSESINLDYQSTGFKWFFNLYFNFLTTNILRPGDIVIMDEPATNLHPHGQIELRKFLKEFAIRNDVTIVIATHSPFLVDMDNLDEIRVISMKDNISTIENDFAAINEDDPDSLKPIKEALTVNNHVFFDPDVKVVFVEGITDYNYMVAMKKILDIKDVIFLPIKGVGDIKSKGIKDYQQEKSKALLKIIKREPILMVDADSAGKSMQKTNEKDSALTVFTLADVNPDFKEIEDLFAENDLVAYDLKEKKSYKSSLFKTHYASSDKVDEKTIKNFKAVFDYIEKL